MAALVFCIVFFAGYWVVDLWVIQPFHLLNFLHLPQVLVWGLALIVFAWLFGDEASYRP